jgi:hypothetical protein
MRKKKSTSESQQNLRAHVRFWTVFFAFWTSKPASDCEQHFQILDDHGVNLAPPAVKNIGNEGRDGVRKALAKGEG